MTFWMQAKLTKKCAILLNSVQFRVERFLGRNNTVFGWNWSFNIYILDRNFRVSRDTIQTPKKCFLKCFCKYWDFNFNQEVISLGFRTAFWIWSDRRFFWVQYDLIEFVLTFQLFVLLRIFCLFLWDFLCEKSSDVKRN